MAVSYNKLYAYLPKGMGPARVDVDDKVLLEYYRLEKDFEGSIKLEPSEGAMFLFQVKLVIRSRRRIR